MKRIPTVLKVVFSGLAGLVVLAVAGGILVQMGVVLPSPAAGVLESVGLAKEIRSTRRALDMWGVEHDLASYEWTLFDFIHSAGCGYCVLNAHEYQDNFVGGLGPAGVWTFGVDIFEEQRDLIDYMKHHRIRFPILTEPDALWSQLRCPGLPGQSFFHNGKHLYGHWDTVTFRNYERFRELLRAAGLAERVRPFRPGGPLKKSLNCIYEDERSQVVVGDSVEPDPLRMFPGLKRVTFRIKKVGEVTNEDLGAGALCIMGSLSENRFLRRLADRIPFEVREGAIAFADTVLTGTDLRLQFCFPNPWNPERYLVVKTGTGRQARDGFVYDGSQDFIISRRCATPQEDNNASFRIIARGIFAKQEGLWSLPKSAILWGNLDGEETLAMPAHCGRHGCPVPEASTGSPRLSAQSGQTNALARASRPESARHTHDERCGPAPAALSADLARSLGLEVSRASLGAGRYPAIAHNPLNGETRVVWQQIVETGSDQRRNNWSILTSAERDGEWSQPAELPNCPPGRNVTPVVTADDIGRTWVFWSHKDHPDARDAVIGGRNQWQILFSVHDTEGWHGPFLLSDSGADARSPAVASSGPSVWIAWHQGQGSALEIMVTRITPRDAAQAAEIPACRLTRS